MDESLDLHFKHQPLETASKSIRVLKILPRRQQLSLIECTIEHVALCDKTYVCLSYMWGDISPTREILLNGRRMIVRQNLWSFLDKVSSQPRRRLKSIYRLPFWIDALCIDQDNHIRALFERGQQVQMMGDIYFKAAWVLIWPGIVGNARLLLSIARAIPKDTDRSTTIDSYKDLFQSLAMSLLKRTLPDDYKSVEELVYKGYWGRLWIWQEILLNSDVRILTGNGLSQLEECFPRSFLHLGSIPRAPKVWTAHQLVCSHRGHRGYIWAQADPAFGGPISLETMLDLTTDSQCQDWHDRIYALKGLCRELRDLPVRYNSRRAQLAGDVIWQVLKERHLEEHSCLLEDSSWIPFILNRDAGLLCCLMERLDVTITYTCPEVVRGHPSQKHSSRIELKIVEWDGGNFLNYTKYESLDEFLVRGLCEGCMLYQAETLRERGIRQAASDWNAKVVHL
ncbi:uncharacterized protein AB675_4662 [Cyphellophora attinorum]|uniref:Heterokaryon incompatibility domain-containing protein n=1 Tax=Cyphellophora attinorum TaxID=1664694 RepID=A0A0N1HNI8_9EURO|nr:uncharacterized protein AB675_4662 [Phialophora attinorum]KPI39100.1 hypothetical protein AB675_4662 [Phialophora attinorum]